ncbi:MULTISPECIES: hypothetical protein [Ralstonia solanacearum species complex]|uniref:hypothetical protein n=1 Tax=Ralstonia solanacearum species complex TaxID=3116862 RepID=UPI001969559B|nr:hypothetical protein [Ralstonia solanacearum]BEU70634.1 hypothetical protein MAFF211271_01890 [Ralstonia pseudosolanacearum]
MAIDPSQFHPINVADTCSVWNILSSARLHAAAMGANCDFCITSFVHYECLVKARKFPKVVDNELRERLIREQSYGRFLAYSCGIADLQTVQVLESRKRLGKGELSSIAFAMKIGQAVITDDQKARRLAESSGHRLTQTTPHLHSWLVFNGHLTDADHVLVKSQHEEMEGVLGPYLQQAYELALQCKLNAAGFAPGDAAPSCLAPPASDESSTP